MFNFAALHHSDYWQKKRERNIRHDKEVTALFENRGWIVVRIWECELKKKNQMIALTRITNALAERDHPHR